MVRKILIIFILLIFSPYNGFSSQATIFTLKNGFKVIVQEEHSTPLIAMQLWVTHGSTSETDREAGVAHFLEHLTFRSKDIAKRIESLGGDINAYTSFDKTVYHLTLPSKYMEEGLKVLQDILFKTKFEEKGFLEEKKVIIEEMKRSYDNPQKMLYDLFFETALKKHPARRPVIGYENTISDITMEEVESFYKRFYNPKTAYLVIVGDIDANLTKNIETLFGYEEGQNIVSLFDYEKESFSQSFSVKAMNVASCYLMLGIPTPKITDPLVPVIDVLSFLYGESSTSLLNERLKEEKQLVNYIYSYQMAMKDMGFFIVQANFSCDKSESVLRELASVLFKEHENFSEEGLKKTIKNYESNYYFTRERFSDMASDIGSAYLYYGDPNYSKRYINEIRHVKVSDIEEAKDTFFDITRSSIVMITPENHKTFGESIIKKYFAPEKSIKDTVKITTLPNGITLITKRKNNLPVFGFTLLSLAGSRMEDKNTAGLSYLTVNCLLRGTKTMSHRELKERIETLGGTISGFSSKNISGIKGKFLSSHFVEAVNLLGEILNNFNPPQEEINKVKNFVVADIQKKRENPTRLLKDLFFETVYPDGPFGLPLEGFEKSINTFDSKMVTNHFKKIFNPKGLIFVISGDIPDDGEKLISKELQKLEPLPTYEKSATLSPSPKDKIKITETNFNQSHIIIGFPVAGMNDEDRPYLQLLSQILSNQSGRLFTKLRDEMGLAYSLGAFMFESPEGSLFNLYIGTSPENTDKAKELLLYELENTLNKGITDDEKEKATNQIITDITMSLQENIDTSSLYGTNMLFFKNPLYFKAYQEKLLAIKAREITERLKKYFTPDRAIFVTVNGKKRNTTP